MIFNDIHVINLKIEREKKEKSQYKSKKKKNQKIIDKITSR